MAPTPTIDTVLLTAGEAQVEIAPATGGAIARFSFRGTDVLRPTPPDVRAERNVRGHACYPLVPYSNRIANARLAFDGHHHALTKNFGDHPHSIHGIGWQREWTVESHEPDRALLSLVYSPGTGSGSDSPTTSWNRSDSPATSTNRSDSPAAPWPWAFRATQSFALAATESGASLILRLGITNVSDAAFPFGLGWHPFFPRTSTTELGFVADGVWQTDATQLPTHHATIPAEWRFDPPRVPGTTPIDNVFTGWTGRASIDDAARGIAVTIDADRSCAFLVVYAPPGRDFLAVEPVTHMTDAFNRAARGDSATGMRTLRPGASFSTTMRIFVRLA